ncbi:hypothetical protein SFC50_01550 [Bacillus infantis]|uniref:hypothetical protein n=1 Tax=Bacillus infantis TaxID=324767 RepID=UPI0039826FB8
MEGKRKRKRKKNSRSKVWKYIFITFLVLLIGGGGTLLYFLKIKTYDVADAKVEEIVDQEYDIVLPGEDGEQASTDSESTADSSEGSDGGAASGTSTSAEAGTSSGTAEKAGKQAQAAQNGSKQASPKTQSPATAGNKGAGTEPDAKKDNPVTVASIKQKYQPTFESLESQANERLNSLVSQAVSEYHTKKANDESISVTYFYRKYSEAGHALENSTDGAFQYVYAALEQDLKKNGFSSSHAATFKTKYENAKKARESALLDKAKSAL